MLMRGCSSLEGGGDGLFASSSATINDTAC